VSHRSLSGHYVESKKGALFVTTWGRVEGATRCVLFVPPFAEEMNKSRRMMAMCAQELAQKGLLAVLPDLYGTGDSHGDFRDADWGTWLTDLKAVSAWLDSASVVVDAIVAVRIGAELAAEASERELLPPIRHAVLWNPVFDSNKYLTQFLRLRTSAMAMQGEAKESVASLKHRFQSGEMLPVAGYTLSPTLGTELANKASRTHIPKNWQNTTWLEAQRDVNAPLAANSKAILEASRERDSIATCHVLQGDPYWTATEIVVIPAIVTATIRALA
jgi:exosortase A-associated hydrolase 2